MLIDKGNQLVQAIQSERQESLDNPLRLKIISIYLTKMILNQKKKISLKKLVKNLQQQIIVVK